MRGVAPVLEQICTIYLYALHEVRAINRRCVCLLVQELAVPRGAGERAGGMREAYSMFKAAGVEELYGQMKLNVSS